MAANPFKDRLLLSLRRRRSDPDVKDVAQKIIKRLAGLFGNVSSGINITNTETKQDVMRRTGNELARQRTKENFHKKIGLT